jgi:hypothetical protein
MPLWNDIFEENSILTTVILLLAHIVPGVVIDPELAGLAASTAP